MSWPIPGSTVAGIIAYNEGHFPFKVPAYGVSKAAMNFLIIDNAEHLKPEGFIVVPIGPRFVIWIKRLSNCSMSEHDWHLIRLFLPRKARRGSLTSSSS
jgi:hypothetical protein